MGYDVVVINYRGLAGAQLTSPKLYSSTSWQDVAEPMSYIKSKYCTDQNNCINRKLFAIGISLGANILAVLVGV